MKGWPRSGCYLVSDASNGNIRRNTEAINETIHTYSPNTTAKIVTTDFGKRCRRGVSDSERGHAPLE